MASLAFSMIQLLGIITVMSQVAWQVFVVFIPVIAVGIWYQVLIGSCSLVIRWQIMSSHTEYVPNVFWKINSIIQFFMISWWLTSNKLLILQQYYLPAARELARLIGICKAPVIQHLAETISGTSTIRSYDQQSRFRETNMKLTDGYSRPKFSVSGAIEWLRFRLDMLSAITFAFSLLVLISIPPGIIDPGM